MRIFFFSIVALALFGNASYGQQIKVRKYTAQLLGKIVLSEVDDKYNARVYSKELPDPDGNAEQQLLHEIKAQIAKNYPHKISEKAERTTSSSVLPPTIGINYVADS